MSYDVALYFNCAEFPHSEWLAVLEPFGAQAKTISEWSVSTEDDGLWMQLEDISASRFINSEHARWKVLISRSGRHPKGAWTQFAIAYHALSHLANITFYDLQHDFYAQDTKSLAAFVEIQLRDFGLSKLFKLGLMDGDGRIDFGRQI